MTTPINLNSVNNVSVDQHINSNTYNNQASSASTTTATNASHSFSQGGNRQHNANGGRNPYRANPNRFKPNRKTSGSNTQPQQQQQQPQHDVDGQHRQDGLDNQEPMTTIVRDEMDGQSLPLAVETGEAVAVAAISSEANRQNVKDKRRPRHQNSKSCASSQSNSKANNSGQRGGGGGGGGNGGFGAAGSGNDFRKVFFYYRQNLTNIFKHQFMAAHRDLRQDLKSDIRSSIRSSSML